MSHTNVFLIILNDSGATLWCNYVAGSKKNLMLVDTTENTENQNFQ